ncbi:MAG: hypothetical protein ACFB9M_14355 [Myxococcota bacterium]
MARLGRYRLAIRIDLGDLAPLFVAFDGAGPVMVRSAASGVGADDRWRRRFMARGTAASALRHPHILGIREVSVARGRPFAVYEPDFGVSLRRLLEAAPLTPSQWARLGLDVMDALDHLHQNGFAGLGLHPDRVMACFTGRFILIDPTMADDGLTPIPRPSRLPYVAPELRSGNDAATWVDPIFADRYALGVLLEVSRPMDLDLPQLLDVISTEPTARQIEPLRSALKRLVQAEDGTSVAVRDRFRRVYALILETLDNQPGEGKRPCAAIGPVMAGAGPVAGMPRNQIRVGGRQLGSMVAGSSLRPIHELVGPPGRWVKLELSGTPTALRTEARRLERLGSLPGLPKVLADRSDDDVPHLILDGPPTQMLTRAFPNPGESTAFWSSLAQLLAAIHAAGLRFGNLQPTALRVTPDGGPFLLDCSGLGRTHFGESPWILAPENLEGALYDGLSEGFAMGALAYQVLTGVRPFRGLDREELSRMMATKEPRPPHLLEPRLHHGLSEAIMGLLQVDRSRRLTLEQVALRLQEAGSTASVSSG